MYIVSLPLLGIFFSTVIFFSNSSWREWKAIDLFGSVIIGGFIAIFPALAVSNIRESSDEAEKAPLWTVFIAALFIGVIVYFAAPAIRSLITGSY